MTTPRPRITVPELPWHRQGGEPDPLRGAIAGAAGGLAGTLALTVIETAAATLGELEGGEEASTVLFTRIGERITGEEPSGTTRILGGQAVHWAFGAAMGALYGVAAEYYPRTATSGYGALFGTAVMINADEIAVPAVGLTRPNPDRPALHHPTSLLAHAVYGAVCEFTRRRVRARL